MPMFRLDCNLVVANDPVRHHRRPPPRARQRDRLEDAGPGDDRAGAHSRQPPRGTGEAGPFLGAAGRRGGAERARGAGPPEPARQPQLSRGQDDRLPPAAGAGRRGRAGDRTPARPELGGAARPGRRGRRCGAEQHLPLHVGNFSHQMPEFSFDVVSEFDSAELTNAVDQARRETGTRFDFKDTATSFELKSGEVIVESSSEDRARAAYQVLVEKAARRSLSPKLFKPGEPKTIGKGRGQIEVKLNAGISDELAKDLQKRARAASPKIQVRIQGDQLRVSSKEKDALQSVIKALRDAEDIPVPLQFTNYR